MIKLLMLQFYVILVWKTRSLWGISKIRNNLPILRRHKFNANKTKIKMILIKASSLVRVLVKEPNQNLVYQTWNARCTKISVWVMNVKHENFTLKKLAVAPPSLAPYLIPSLSALSTNSWTLLKGLSVLSVVKKAARLAVYEATIISVKNHHIPATILVEIELKRIKNVWQACY